MAAALVLTLVLADGCEPLAPDSNGSVISFSASSLKLSAGDTKGGTTIEGTNFAGSEKIAVFGWHSEGTGDKWVFTNKDVTCGAVEGSINKTSYTPGVPWEWVNHTTDYYDFIAFYKWKSGTYTKTASPTSVTVPYDAMTDQYDLMAAGSRRLGSAEKPNEVVPLTFRHLLCAVRVIIYNDSEAKPFTLTDLHFHGLVVSDRVVLTLTPPSTISEEWIDPATNTGSELFGFNSDVAVDYGTSYIWPNGLAGNYILLAPQTLTGSSKLEISYSYNAGTELAPVNKNSSLSLGLSTIPNATDGQLLTSWEQGRKYDYNIHIRVDGGVVVSVVTTEWDPIEAQTHGIMI